VAYSRPEDPYRVYALAREKVPVFYNASFDAWVVTRHEHVLAVLRDTRTFTSRYAMDSGDIPAAVREQLPDGWPWAHPGLSNLDPPAHSRVRRLLNEDFKPQAIAGLEEQIVQIVDELIDGFVDDGHIEFMSGFADRLPVRVVCRLLEISDEHIDSIFRWADDMLVLFSNPAATEEERVERAEGMVAYTSFLHDVVSERRVRPGEDLLSRLVQAAADEPVLGQAELVSILAQLIQAGTDTVSRFLGLLLLRLLEDPDQLEAVRTTPALAAKAVEEALRHSTSNLGLMRRATREVELAGTTIPAGAEVVLMFASANHDESTFVCPARFDIGRGDVGRHLAFGKYGHFCLGAALARLEARVALQRLLARLPNLRRAGDGPVEMASLALHMAPLRLDLEWIAETSPSG
jgi:cytochrome P450